MFEETLLSPLMIQSLNFGKPAKAPSHCRCCLCSVRDVWISFLAVTEMTLFPLIKGYRCQESDVNFPAQLLRGHDAQERAMKQKHKKKLLFFFDRVFDKSLNKMSRMYIFWEAVIPCLSGRSSDKILAESWLFQIRLSRELLIFWVSASRFCDKECFNVKTSCAGTFPLPRLSPSKTSHLPAVFQLNLLCKSGF